MPGRLSTSHSISRFGGLESVALVALEAHAEHLAAAMKKWAPAADVLQMLVYLHDPDLSLNGGPSISKAIMLCAGDREGRSEGHIRRIWGEYCRSSLAAGALLATEVGVGGRRIFSAAWHAPDSETTSPRRSPCPLDR